MPGTFAQLDVAGVARALTQIADQPADLADAFFEQREDLELPPEDAEPGFRVWRESGLAVRLVRQGRTWLASRDEMSSDIFQDALRRVARAMPRAPYPQPAVAVEPWIDPPAAPELLDFPSAVQRALRSRHLSLPLRLRLRRHRRSTLLVGSQLASAVQHEAFYSIQVDTEWGRLGRLVTDLGAGAAEELAQAVARAYHAREAAPPELWQGPVVLGPVATAVLLHETVAHALEADTLALGGHPEAAVGVRLGAEILHVIDDPASAPESVRRTTDDEGFPVVRRWLLRAGRIEQPLCDRFWARQSEVLTAGAGRRGNRHLPPGPRSTHLELVAGDATSSELMADAEGGLYFPEVSRGHLDPLSGRFVLHFPSGRRILNQLPGPPVGPCSLSGHVTDLLAAVRGIGSEVRVAGAGWCAKGGVKLPVWATTPEIRLEGLEIRP